ncbi:hypothetical protein EK904_002721 [Melospiza melodia maxima]|nr:hypothetical protein EK904_002721 [Melospiza melodia maxima]
MNLIILKKGNAKLGFRKGLLISPLIYSLVQYKQHKSKKLPFMCALGDFAPSVSNVLERIFYKCHFQEQESEMFKFSAKEIQLRAGCSSGVPVLASAHCPPRLRPSWSGHELVQPQLFSMSLFKEMDCSLRQTWISGLVCHLCNTGRHHNVSIYLHVPFFEVCIKCKLTIRQTHPFPTEPLHIFLLCRNTTLRGSVCSRALEIIKILPVFFCRVDQVVLKFWAHTGMCCELRQACVQNSFLPAGRLQQLPGVTPGRVTAAPAQQGAGPGWVLPSPLGQFDQAQKEAVSSLSLHPTNLKEVLSWVSQSHPKLAEPWIKLSYAGTNVSGVLRVISKQKNQNKTTQPSLAYLKVGLYYTECVNCIQLSLLGHGIQHCCFKIKAVSCFTRSSVSKPGLSQTLSTLPLCAEHLNCSQCLLRNQLWPPVLQTLHEIKNEPLRCSHMEQQPLDEPGRDHVLPRALCTHSQLLPCPALHCQPGASQPLLLDVLPLLKARVRLVQPEQSTQHTFSTWNERE